MALGLIELRNSNVNTCNVIRENTKPHIIPNRITTLIDSFRETVFSGQVGKLKNYQVIVKQDRTNKLSPNFKCHPYAITAQKGTMNTAKSNIDGHCTTRNISHFKKIPLHVKFPFIKEEEEGALIEQNAENHHEHQAIAQDSARKQYPKRIRRSVQDWRKY